VVTVQISSATPDLLLISVELAVLNRHSISGGGAEPMWTVAPVVTWPFDSA